MILSGNENDGNDVGCDDGSLDGSDMDCCDNRDRRNAAKIGFIVLTWEGDWEGCSVGWLDIATGIEVGWMVGIRVGWDEKFIPIVKRK